MNFFRFKSLLLSLVLFSSVSIASSITIITITVKGMTCSFCTYTIKKELKKIKNVDAVHISLQHKQARVRMKPGMVKKQVITKEIVKALKQAGYSYGKIKFSDITR